MSNELLIFFSTGCFCLIQVLCLLFSERSLTSHSYQSDRLFMPREEQHYEFWPAGITSVYQVCLLEFNRISTTIQSCSEELKIIIGKISQLRSELQTNKPLRPLVSAESPDFQKWSNYYSAWAEVVVPRWFDSPWLYIECHMYRFLQDIFEQRFPDC